MIFAGKKVLVFGTGKSGIAAEDLLHKKGASVVLYDGNDKLEKEEILKKLESRDSVEVVLGELPEEMLDSLDLVVLSPGVPTDLPVVLKMKEKEIPVIGEVELAYQVSRGKVLAITGTNGKTTTTSLLGEIMKTYQPEVKVVGNIGTPYTSVALDTTDDTVTVAEISSFQLETIKEFHPAASAITNITEDHLNRHHTMEEYIRVKECITENQTMDDLCVLNYEDEILRPFGEKLMAEKKVQVMYFSSLRALKDGIYYQDGEIRIAKNGETELLTRTDDLKLPDKHRHDETAIQHPHLPAAQQRSLEHEEDADEKGAGQLARADVIRSFIRHLPGEGGADNKIKECTSGQLCQHDRQASEVEGRSPPLEEDLHQMPALVSGLGGQQAPYGTVERTLFVYLNAGVDHHAQQNEKRDIERQQRELQLVEAGALGRGVEHIGQPQQRQQHPQRPQAGVRPVLERDAERHRSSPPQQCPEDDMACKKIHSTPPM